MKLTTKGVPGIN